MKIGRNDPCICGSGKKYKKCCFGKKESKEQPLKTNIGDISDYPMGMHPYYLARIRSDPDNMCAANFTKKQIKRLREKWNPNKLKSMQTADIVARLAEFGVNANKDAFISLADVGYTSAWKLATHWFDNDAECLPTGDDKDFVCFAACELWKRYLPERPSAEMVDDWVQEGYDLEEAGKSEEACEYYQKVWKRMLEFFTPEMKTFGSVEPIFNISQSFSNWVQDYQICLDNLTVAENSWLKVGIPLAEKIIQQFSEEDMIWTRCAVGRWLIQDGRVEEGVAALEEIISSHPDRADGYISLVHARDQSKGLYLNTEDAIKMLKRAKAACPQDEINAWDIETRLDNLIAQ